MIPVCSDGLQQRPQILQNMLVRKIQLKEQNRYRRLLGLANLKPGLGFKDSEHVSSMDRWTDEWTVTVDSLLHSVDTFIAKDTASCTCMSDHPYISVHPPTPTIISRYQVNQAVSLLIEVSRLHSCLFEPSSVLGFKLA